MERIPWKIIRVLRENDDVMSRKDTFFGFVNSIWKKQEGAHVNTTMNIEKISTLDPCFIFVTASSIFDIAWNHTSYPFEAPCSCSRTIERVDWFWQLAYLIPAFAFASDCGISSISDFYNLDRIYLFFSTWKCIENKSYERMVMSSFHPRLLLQSICCIRQSLSPLQLFVIFLNFFLLLLPSKSAPTDPFMRQ